MSICTYQKCHLKGIAPPHWNRPWSCGSVDDRLQVVLMAARQTGEYDVAVVQSSLDTVKMEMSGVASDERT